MGVGLTLVVCSYLVGSISSAVVTCCLMGLPDPRTQGSGNPGATNVLRLGGKKAATFTLLGDVLKGFLPVWAAAYLIESPAVLAAVAVAAFIGHLYPVFLGFRGGKGVATALGALIALAWPVALFAVTTWLVTAIVGRYSSLASLTAAVLAPVSGAVLGLPSAYLTGISTMSVLLVWRHRANISRLLAGEESKIVLRRGAT
jgi:glycerol-3-phosphate acyltransferase PlsY